MNKTVSLETAKKLINVRIRLKTESGYHTNENFTGIRSTLDDDYIPAPDIPELLAELPQALNGYCLHIVNGDHTWEVYYSDDVLFQGKELVIALAQALMWVRSKAEVKNER
jgi:hypothetical protein